MKLRYHPQVSFVFAVGIAFSGVASVASGCHLINGIDQFETDPSLDVVALPPCATESDCPGMTNECGRRECMNNTCSLTLEMKGTEVLQQVAGDCKVNQCDGAGNRVDGILDPSDVFDDGNECTVDGCSANGEPTQKPVVEGQPCAMGTKYCDGKGACVQCVPMKGCPVDRVCSMNVCVLETCINGTKGEQESDIDCGGPDCSPCDTDKSCNDGADCLSKTCTMNKCAMPTCDDMQQNAEETDVDCGGIKCPACDTGKQCLNPMDCMSKVCTANACQAPNCKDMVRNGDEIDEDCGGSCGPCPDGSMCTKNADCKSEFCVSGEGKCAKVVQVVTGTKHACAVVETAASKGKLYCWGGNHYGELGFGPSGLGASAPVPTLVNLPNVTSVSAFSNASVAGEPGGHTCARTEEIAGMPKIKCWGRNENGQLGNNSQTSTAIPVDVAFGAGAKPQQVVTGGRHTCAIMTDTNVQCWGANGHGQIGTGTTSPPRYVVPMPAISVNGANPMGAVQLALGTVHTCARLSPSNAVACWGYDEMGQVGIKVGSDQTKARILTNVGSISQLATGQDFTCVMTTGISCWGDNSDKQFGQGNQISPIQPLLVQGVSPNARVPLTLGAAGDDSSTGTRGGHSCFVEGDGTLVCLGLNDRGQVGLPAAPTPVDVPTTVMADMAGSTILVKKVALGTQFTCAILEQGAIRCWGRNDKGQLGNGGTTDTHIPTPVSWPGP